MGKLNPWKDGQNLDGLDPEMDGKVLEWVARRLRHSCWSSHLRDRYDVTKEELTEAVEWLMLEPDRYVIWKNTETCKGSGFSNGEWEFWEELIPADFEVAIDVLRRKYARRRDECKIDSL